RAEKGHPKENSAKTPDKTPDRKAERRREAEEGEEAGTDYLEAHLFQMRQRAFPNDSVQWRAYPAARPHRDPMPPARLGRGGAVQPRLLGGSWQFVGPENLAVPYRIYYGTQALNGRVNAVAYDPIVPNTYYLGAAGGGLWKTTDGGNSWTPLSDNWPALE